MADQDKIITDEEMANLPDDDQLAFVVYEERLRAKTRDKTADQEGSSLEREYVNHILAFISVVNLNVAVDRDPPFLDNDFWEWYHRFQQVIDYRIVEIRLAHARDGRSGVTTAIYLSEDYRTEIHKLLGRVRKVVNTADLPDAKKDDIYDKINALQSEVDRSKTRLDAFHSRWLDVTNAAGEGAENLEPVVKLLGHVMRIFGRAKTEHDVGKLPPPDVPQKLPSPATDQPPQADLDDEIPF